MDTYNHNAATPVCIPLDDRYLSITARAMLAYGRRINNQHLAAGFDLHYKRNKRNSKFMPSGLDLMRGDNVITSIEGAPLDRSRVEAVRRVDQNINVARTRLILVMEQGESDLSFSLRQFAHDLTIQIANKQRNRRTQLPGTSLDRERVKIMHHAMQRMFGARIVKYEDYFYPAYEMVATWDGTIAPESHTAQVPGFDGRFRTNDARPTARVFWQTDDGSVASVYAPIGFTKVLPEDDWCTVATGRHYTIDGLSSCAVDISRAINNPSSGDAGYIVVRRQLWTELTTMQAIRDPAAAVDDVSKTVATNNSYHTSHRHLEGVRAGRGDFSLGYEWEISFTGTDRHIGARQLAAQLVVGARSRRFVHVENDSTTGPNGLEFVVAYAPLAQQREVLSFAAAHDNASAKPIQRHIDDVTFCGMHVHVDADALPLSHMRLLSLMLGSPDNRAHVEAFAGRGPNNFLRVPKQQVYSMSSPSIASASVELGNRYNNVNFRTSTFEVRIFKSPSSYRGVLRNLQFVDACVRYVSTLSGFASWADLDIANVVSYAAKHPSKYDLVLAFWADYKRLPELVGEYVAAGIISETETSRVCLMLANGRMPAAEVTLPTIAELTENVTMANMARTAPTMAAAIATSTELYHNALLLTTHLRVVPPVHGGKCELIDATEQQVVDA